MIHPPTSAAAALIAAPALLLGPLLVPQPLCNRRPLSMGRYATTLSAVALVFALAGLAIHSFLGTISVTFAGAAPFQIGVRGDALALTIYSLVAFLGVIIARYATRFLEGDLEQGRFFKWLCSVLGCVLALTISSNLVMFTAAWIGMSLSLHHLLVFYPWRPAALLAARKKFVISRLGDLCLISAAVLCWRHFHTCDFETLFRSAASLRYSGAVPRAVDAVALLIVTGALLKSAQFPFHTWLPDTMETPTPVSALMHAGVINAGGFLVIRMSPLVGLAPAALALLTLAGAFTAVFASLAATTQTSVKRTLGYSTIAQMGFMMFECGLGAFPMALLHIVAHSLYKSHAFLSAGNLVTRPRQYTAGPTAIPLLIATATVAGAAALWLHNNAGSNAGQIALLALVALASATILRASWNSRNRLFTVAGSLALTIALLSLYAVFHTLLDGFLQSSAAALAGEKPNTAIILLATLLFLVAYLLPAFPSLAGKLHDPIYHGFHFGSLLNKLVKPSPSPDRSIL